MAPQHVMTCCFLPLCVTQLPAKLSCPVYQTADVEKPIKVYSFKYLVEEITKSMSEGERAELAAEEENEDAVRAQFFDYSR